MTAIIFFAKSMTELRNYDRITELRNYDRITESKGFYYKVLKPNPAWNLQSGLCYQICWFAGTALLMFNEKFYNVWAFKWVHYYSQVLINGCEVNFKRRPDTVHKGKGFDFAAHGPSNKDFCDISNVKLVMRGTKTLNVFDVFT